MCWYKYMHTSYILQCLMAIIHLMRLCTIVGEREVICSFSPRDYRHYVLIHAYIHTPMPHGNHSLNDSTIYVLLGEKAVSCSFSLTLCADTCTHHTYSSASWQSCQLVSTVLMWVATLTSHEAFVQLFMHVTCMWRVGEIGPSHSLQINYPTWVHKQFIIAIYTEIYVSLAA